MATTYNNAADYSPTQYNVQVGGASGTLHSVAPGTTGIPLISQGASSNPAFGTAVVAGGGTGAVTLTGVLIGNGTSAVTGNAITQYDVLVGGASNAITSVAPSATSGIPLVSGGSAANPSFTTAVVAGGGTGAVTFTAYAPIIAGTTATGAFQSASTGLSTSGYVLTSNGSSSLPSFQAAAGGGITTIDGDSGSVTGSTVTLTAGSALNSGSSVSFSGSGTTLTFNPTDANNNTLVGNSAGKAGISGTSNTGFGYGALSGLTSGTDNTAIGLDAGLAITQGVLNVAIGESALSNTTTGHYNIGIGYQAGLNIFGGDNSNICIGYQASGSGPISNNLQIGNGTGTSTGNLNSAKICGITGIVVTGATAIISSANQLGVLASSKQFKNDIQDMADESNAVMKLRPVTFVWNKDSAPGLKDATTDRQFGVIAEEAALVAPTLVNYDAKGNPFSFKYSELPAILLNELQKALKRIEALEQKLGSK